MEAVDQSLGPMRVITMVGHMHEQGVDLVLRDSRTGEMVYHQADWRHPPSLLMTPPADMTARPLTLECAYDNRSDVPLAVGLSAADAMCMVIGYAIEE